MPQHLELTARLQNVSNGVFIKKKAFAGDITNFTGVSDPYEPPENLEITLDTGMESEAQSVAKVLDFLTGHGYY